MNVNTLGEMFGEAIGSGQGPIVEWYLRSSLLLAVAWLAHLILSRTRPTWRVVLWRVVCVAFVALPLGTLVLPPLFLPILPAQDRVVVAQRPPSPALPTEITPRSFASQPEIQTREPEASPRPLAEPIGGARASGPKPGYAPAPARDPVVESVASGSETSGGFVSFPDSSAPFRWPRPSVIGAGLWVLGVGILVGVRALRRRALAPLLRGLTPADKVSSLLLSSIADEMGVRREIRLLISPTVSTPALLDGGVARVVLPENFASKASTEELRAVFAHEIAHLSNRDPVWRSCIAWISILAWPQSLLWFVGRAHLRACEEQADLSAVRYLRDTRVYASVLARLALKWAQRSKPRMGLSMVWRPGIVTRLRRLENPSLSSRVTRNRARLWGLGWIVLALCVATLTPSRALTPSENTGATESRGPVAELDESDRVTRVIAQTPPNSSTTQISTGPNDDNPSLIGHPPPYYGSDPTAYLSSGPGDTFGTDPALSAKTQLAVNGYVPPPISRTYKSRVFGRVIHEETGEPVPHAEVAFGFQLPGTEIRVNYGLVARYTDEEGNFEFSGLGKGIWLGFVQDETKGITSAYTTDDLIPVVLRSNDDVVGPITFEVHEGRKPTFTIQSATDGKTISGARVVMGWAYGREKWTDSNGKLTFASMPQQGQYFVIEAPGYARNSRMVGPGRRRTINVNVRLKPGGTIYGQATDPEGYPLADCFIKAGIYGTTGHVWNTRTDENGNYRFDTVPLRENVHLYYGVTDPDLMRYQNYVYPLKKVIHIGDGKTSLEVNAVLPWWFVKPDGILRGFVRDSESRPVANARIRYGRLDDIHARTVHTDEEGWFEIDRVPRGLINGDGFIRIYAEGYQSRWIKADPGRPEDTPTLSIKLLDNPHWIEGVVTDSAGEPVRYPVVATAVDQGVPMREIVTDDRGRFRFDDLADGVHFRFQRAGFYTRVDSRFSLDRAGVSVALGSLGIVKGRVVDATTGAPIKRYMMKGNFPGGPPGIEMESDDGTFEIVGIDAGENISLEVYATGYAPGWFRRIKALEPAKARSVTLKIEPTQLLRVAGTILNDDNEPRVGIGLDLVNYRAQKGSSRPVGWGSDTGESRYYVNSMHSTVTDESGRFTFENVSADGHPIDIIVSDKRVGRTRLMLEKLSAARWQNIDIQTHDAGRIRGRLHEPLEGTIPQQITATAVKGSLRLYTYLDKTTGEYEIEGVPPGGYLVTASGSRAESTAINVRPGETIQANLGFGTVLKVVGRVAVDGRPVENWLVALSAIGSNSSATQTVTTDPEGNFSFHETPEGSYEIALIPPHTGSSSAKILSQEMNQTWIRRGISASPYRKRIQLKNDNQWNDLSFNSHPGLSGQFLNIPSEHMRVVLRPTNVVPGRLYQSLHTYIDTDGGFSFNAVPAGEYTIYLSQGEFLLEVRDIEVADLGQDISLAPINLPSMRRVDGQLTSVPEGLQRVSLGSEPSELQDLYYTLSSIPDPDGRIEFPHVPQGIFKLTWEFAWGNLQGREIDVAEDDLDLGRIDPPLLATVTGRITPALPAYGRLSIEGTPTLEPEKIIRSGVTADKEGRISIPSLPEGRYDLRANLGGTSFSLSEFEVADSGELDLGAIQAPPLTEVHGELKDAPERLQGLAVYGRSAIAPDKMFHWFWRLDEKGSLPPLFLPEGRYKIGARLGGVGFDFDELEVPEGQADLDLGAIGLPELIPVRGKLSYPDEIKDRTSASFMFRNGLRSYDSFSPNLGRAPGEAGERAETSRSLWIEARSIDPGISNLRANPIIQENGAISIAGLPPGEYALMNRLEGETSAIATFLVVSGSSIIELGEIENLRAMVVPEATPAP